MSQLHERIAANTAAIRARIGAAAIRSGRTAGDVRLVAVTKSVDAEVTQVLVNLGVRHLAENRPAIARTKIDTLGLEDVYWHMIGPVQRRKANDVVLLFSHVDAVDRIEVAEALEKCCALHGKVLPILIEVNVSGEASKHGFSAEDLARALDRIRTLPHLRVEGLMTMAPFVDDPEQTRPVFARLRHLAQPHGLSELSMGMTNDFEVAIEEGATQVRIGAALFE